MAIFLRVVITDREFSRSFSFPAQPTAQAKRNVGGKMDVTVYTLYVNCI